MWVVLGIILFAVGIMNIYEGGGVLGYGWKGRNFRLFDESPTPLEHSYYWTGIKETFLWFLTLPGAMLGFVLGIILFQWTHW